MDTTKQATKINNIIGLLGNLALLFSTIQVLLKIFGVGYVIDLFNIIFQVFLTIALFYVVYKRIPKYHDGNLEEVNIKRMGKYSDSVYLLLEIELAKLFERVYGVSLVNFVLLITENGTLSLLGKIILTILIVINIIFLIILCFLRNKKPKNEFANNIMYVVLTSSIILMLVNLIIPILFIVELSITLMNEWLLLIVLVSIVTILIFVVRRKYYKKKN